MGLPRLSRISRPFSSFDGHFSGLWWTSGCWALLGRSRNSNQHGAFKATKFWISGQPTWESHCRTQMHSIQMYPVSVSALNHRTWGPCASLQPHIREASYFTGYCRLLQRLQNLSPKGHRSIVVESWSWRWLLHVAGVSAACPGMSTHISSIQSHDSIWTVCCLCFEELLEPQWSIGHGHIPQCTTSKHPGNRHLEKKKLITENTVPVLSQCFRACKSLTIIYYPFTTFRSFRFTNAMHLHIVLYKVLPATCKLMHNPHLASLRLR